MKNSLDRHHKKRSKSKSRSRSVTSEKKRHRSRSRERTKKKSSRRDRRSHSRDRDRQSHSRDNIKRSHSRDYDRRSRSRDPDLQIHSRDRDRERRDRKRERRRGESKENSGALKSRKRSRSKERNSKEKHNEELPFDHTKLDKDEEQKRLELEMQKRRDRIERWRSERKKKELEAYTYDVKPNLADLQLPAKKWSLENDSDEEIPVVKGKEEKPEVVDPVDEEEIDSLDAYMIQVQEEVRKVGKVAPKTESNANGNSSGVMIITGVARKRVQKQKGELIEQNQDGLEYSSEEETENLHETAAGIANKQKRELPKVDHTNTEYLPFRKAFYVEVPEIARMTSQEVELYKEKLEGIKVKGKGCPKPIKSWVQCGITKKELDVLKKLGHEKPTPIQSQAIPAIMSGRDLIGIAKTGSGKTLAFLMPMIRHILDQPPVADGEGPITLIMTPTRELCMQIGRDSKKFTKSLGLRHVCVYGGTGISEQIAELKRGAEIIVCTPGRMIDMLAANSGRVTNLKRVSYVVLDEADRMFDMGFEPQVMKIMENVQPNRQTVLFSATFPRQMEALARRILQKPVEIQVGGRSVVCKEVEQHVVVIDEEQKFFKLLEILGHYQNKGSVIVFVNKQEHADMLLKDLMKASYSCMSLHGGIDQCDREATILDFKVGRIKLLIATSVAARGLDVKQLVLVVNYDCPNHYEDYIHRCGRTGRAGNKGFAYTFITLEQERYAGDIIRAHELTGVPVPEELKELWDKYKARLAADGKKVHTGGGFSGKGFKFDESETALANEKKKFQKAALGLQDSDEEDIESEMDQKIEIMLAPKRSIKEVSHTGIFNQSTATDKFKLAQKLASKINFVKNLGPEAKEVTQQAAKAILEGTRSINLITVSNYLSFQSHFNLSKLFVIINVDLIIIIIPDFYFIA
ncbi:hypothetical protein G9C98_008313 [Cotesia typhae]|uniref:Probable ATP-dependent RNA helicase DDX46 n=1 Tax=Cotesia typhae TaxID=2053667 RepID=A0A8J5QUZ1_9HYME|nr:hypothetical protein G9C98_008313 [Cotesia typhae]